MSYSVVTTTLSAAASIDLTDLATAKTELSISNTANDTWLAKAITQVSRSIASYTKRVLVPEVIQDVFGFQDRPRGSRATCCSVLQLSRWPVIVIASIVQTLSDGSTQTLVEGTDFRVDTKSGELLRLDSNGYAARWETVPTTAIYMSGFGSEVAETHAVPVSPFQVTVAQSATFSCDRSVKYSSGTALTRVSANPAAGQYAVAAGVYTFAAADLGQSLTFDYGIKAIPEDLVEVSLRLITARFRSKDRDPALVQIETPGVGIQRWWFGGAPGQRGQFAPEIEGVLEQYCMPVLG